jgi:hypothetical protein
MSILSFFKSKPALVYFIGYLAFYFLASWMDLATTSLGLTRLGVTEKNVLTITSEGYSPERAWLITVIGAIILAACVLNAFRNSQRVKEHWLQHPIRSFGEFYINPWSEAAIGFTPIHFLAFSIAFPIFRILASINNLAIYWYDIAPIGELMGIVGSKTSPLIGFTLVGFSFFALIVIAVAPFAAKMIVSLRQIP